MNSPNATMPGVADTHPSGRLATRQTESELMLAWRDGDRVAGGKLLRRHWSSIRAFFRRRVGCDCDELVQRTFVICVESHARVRDAGNLRSYAHGVARNVLRVHQREQRRANLRDPVELAPAADLAMESAADAAQHRGRLLHALERLGEEDQDLLRLYYWQRMSSSQIAARKGLSASSIRARLGRARRTLARYLVGASGCVRAFASSEELDAWATAGRRSPILPSVPSDAPAVSRFPADAGPTRPEYQTHRSAPPRGPGPRTSGSHVLAISLDSA